MDTIKKIRKKLEESLDEERFEHTLGVAKTAQFLACLYNEDKEKAYIAGLLHDCAKNIPHKDKIKMCEKSNVSISDVEMQNPSLLHAKAGAIVARQKYGVSDEDILNAISSHTTGRPDMSLLEKIVFVADYIEPGRLSRPGLDEIRNISVKNIDQAVATILHDTLLYLADSAKAIDQMTSTTFDYYSEYLVK